MLPKHVRYQAALRPGCANPTAASEMGVLMTRDTCLQPLTSGTVATRRQSGEIGVHGAAEGERDKPQPGSDGQQDAISGADRAFRGPNGDSSTDMCPVARPAGARLSSGNGRRE